MNEVKNNQIRKASEPSKLPIAAINFFRSAQELTKDEFDQVMQSLESKEARVRFKQQRTHGGRTFLQAGIDSMECNPTSTSKKAKKPLGSMPLIPWAELPELLKRSDKTPLTKKENEQLWDELKYLRGGEATAALLKAIAEGFPKPK